MGNVSEGPDQDDVVKRGQLREDDLSELSRSRDWHDRRKAAWNPSAPVETLKVLSSDKVQWVREAVAGNVRCPEDILALLARDADGFVRAAVAINQKTPAHILGELADDEMTDYDYTIN